MKNNWLIISFAVITSFVFFITYLPSANDLPRGIHQWAQADRLALCFRFIQGKPLTEPATLSMKTLDGNTGVEFSGYQYILAQFVKSGYPQKWLPIMYKSIGFLLFFSALFVLTNLILEEEPILIRNLTFIGLWSSPILVYYGYNYVPDILALGLLLWSFFFFYKDFEKYIFTILIISGLSMLIKTSSGIYFISFMAIYFLCYWNKWDLKLVLSGAMFVLIGSFIAYYDVVLVNGRNAEFNSYVFLSSTMPTKTWSDFTHILNVASRFKAEYFNGAQRVLLLVVAIVGLANLKRYSLKNKHTQLAILISLGLVSIVLLFGIQFMNHDYYVIGTFIPILIYSVLRMLKFILKYIHPRTSLILVSLFAFISFSIGNQRYFNRMSEVVWINNYPEYYDWKWLESVEEKIEKFIDKDDLVFSVYSPEPNFPLVHMNRKGATFNAEEMAREQSPFNLYLRRLDCKYIICNAKYESELQKDQPKFVEQSEVLLKDKKVIIYKYGH